MTGSEQEPLSQHHHPSPCEPCGWYYSPQWLAGWECQCASIISPGLLLYSASGFQEEKGDTAKLYLPQAIWLLYYSCVLNYLSHFCLFVWHSSDPWGQISVFLQTELCTANISVLLSSALILHPCNLRREHSSVYSQKILVLWIHLALKSWHCWADPYP